MRAIGSAALLLLATAWQAVGQRPPDSCAAVPPRGSVVDLWATARTPRAVVPGPDPVGLEYLAHRLAGTYELLLVHSEGRAAKTAEAGELTLRYRPELIRRALGASQEQFWGDVQFTATRPLDSLFRPARRSALWRGLYSAPNDLWFRETDTVGAMSAPALHEPGPFFQVLTIDSAGNLKGRWESRSQEISVRVVTSDVEVGRGAGYFCAWRQD